jgi:DNA-binding response OmpR family regulator
LRDLLLLDVAMPGMDGPQTLALLRERPALSALPAAFLTAATQAREIDRYRRLGVDDVIAKPFDPAELCARIDALLVAPAAPVAAAECERALVVEDDAAIRFLLRFILDQAGYGIVEAIDGDAAAEAIARGADVDVVLLDIQLPGIDGLTLLARLRADPRWNAVPVLMLTAHGSEAQVTAALDAGADDYLGKPFDPGDLLDRLRRLKASRRR